MGMGRNSRAPRRRTVQGTRPRWPIALAALAVGASAHAQSDFPPEPRSPRPQGSGLSAPGSQGESGPLVPGSAVGASGAPGLRAPVSTFFGIRTDVIYTDNATFAPKGQEKDEVRLEVAPYMSVFANTQKTQGTLFYSPRFILRTLEGASNAVRHDLAATGNHYLYDDNVGLRATANVFDTNESPFGTTSVDPSVNPSNRTRYSAFSLSPYARGRLAGTVDAEARYRIDYIDQGGNFESEIVNRVSGAMGSLSGTSRLGWRVAGTAAQSEYEQGFKYDRTFVTGLGYYVFNASERIGLGVNCASNSILRDSEGRDSGCGPAVSGEWRPTPRTTVNGFFADAYYGWTGFARVLHLVDRWAFGLNGRKGVFDRGDSGTQFLDPLLGVAGEGSLSSANKALLDVIETRNRGIVPGQRSSLSFGGIQSAIVDERAVNATLGYAFGRTAYGATLFYIEQSTNTLNIVDNLSPLPGALTDLTQRGVDLNGSYRVDVRGSIVGGYRFSKSTSDSAATSSRLDTYYAGYRAELSRRLSAGLVYRFSSQRANGAAAVDYDENAVIATLDFRL